MPQIGWSKQQKCISQGSGGQKSKGKFPRGLVSGEDPLFPPCRPCLLAVCSHDLFFVFWGGGAVSTLGSLIRTLVLLEKDSTLMTSFSLNCLLIGPISMYSHTGGWGFNPTYEFGGTLFSPLPTSA